VPCRKGKANAAPKPRSSRVVDQTLLVMLIKCVWRSSCEVSAHWSMVRFTVANCRLTLPLLRVEMKRVATMVGEKAVMHVEYALIMFFLHAHVHREFPSSPSFLSLAFVLFVCACVRMRAGGENGRGLFCADVQQREHCHGEACNGRAYGGSALYFPSSGTLLSVPD
jgi:hypothetical protein